MKPNQRKYLSSRYAYIYLQNSGKESSKSKLKVLLRKKGPRQTHDLNFRRVSNLKTK